MVGQLANKKMMVVILKFNLKLNHLTEESV